MKNFQILASALNHHAPFSSKLRSLHASLVQRFPEVDRVAVALYDAKTDTLKTFAHSSGSAAPLSAYQAKLADTPSLKRLAETRNSRVIQDLAEIAPSPSEHSRRITAEGYRSSYTMPMFLEGELIGFLFFDSYRQGAFGDDLVHYLDLFGHLVSLVIINELTTLNTLVGTVQVARSFTHLRDVETLAHLDRMARYARIIATELAGRFGFDDEFIEHVFLFAPLHDIGKIGVPDSVLMKPGALDADEERVMKSHVVKGREMVERIVQDFGLQSVRHVEILRNIVEYHHEAVDGSGYPKGLRGDQIPIETRIIVVADVFDALTSRRPYKPAWSNERAFSQLRSLAGVKLDADCVLALERNRPAVEAIQARFREAA
jgi:HD-GYP domain-containing protein (c-di-GMP phosphodiesterase class II)